MVCHIQVWQKRDDKWNFADPWPIELLTSEQRCMEFRQALRFSNRRAVNVLEGIPVSNGYDGTYELGDDPDEYRYWLEICHEYDFKYRLKR